MNATERKFADLLEIRRLAGEIAGWSYESVTFTLTQKEEGSDKLKGMRYTPDFLVVHTDGKVEFIEVKGFLQQDDSIGKLKMAAAMYPWFYFTLASRPKKEWIIHAVS